MVRVLSGRARNICRLPVAQSVFEGVLRREGLKDRLESGSAGTGERFAGEPSDEHAQESARLLGLDIRGQRVPRIQPEKCELFDCVLVMDEENSLAVPRFRITSAVVRQFRDFATYLPELDVSTAHFGEVDGFERMFGLWRKLRRA